MWTLVETVAITGGVIVTIMSSLFVFALRRRVRRIVNLHPALALAAMGVDVSFERRLRRQAGLLPDEMDQLCNIEAYQHEQDSVGQDCPVCLLLLESHEPV